MKHLLVLITAVCLACPAFATELGDDGLHKASWMRDTFKDLPEDLVEANAEGKRMVLMIEQRGCIYCTKMHEEVYPQPELASYISDNFYVVQINLYGDLEIIDFDGEELTEKQAVCKWGMIFTPTILFLPDSVPEGQNATQAAVAVMPGAFGFGTTLDMFTWVYEKRYELDSKEDFQRYHARRGRERASGTFD